MGRPQTSLEVRKIMDCLRSSEQIPMDELVPSPESPAPKDYISSVHSSRAGEAGQKPDTGNIEGAESSLRESGCLNYEEARALLGRYEYQKGNIEAALLVFEGIDIALVTPKLKLALAERVKTQKRRSQSFSKPTLSIHAVSVLLEAVFLKEKFLQALQRYKGLLNQSKGLYKAALEDYSNALAVYPSHVSSLVSSAVVLRKIGKQSPAIIRSLLTEALRLDRMNASAWCNLRLLYEEEGLGSALEEEEEEKKERGGED